MSLLVKICGLSTPETVDAALRAGADMVGLNFFPPSPRFVALEQAAALADRARGRAEVTAVTVDMDEVARRFCTQSSVPLVLDSTEPRVMEAGLQWLGGRSILAREGHLDLKQAHHSRRAHIHLPGQVLHAAGRTPPTLIALQGRGTSDFRHGRCQAAGR